MVCTSQCGSYTSDSLVAGSVTHARLVLSEVPNKEREKERERERDPGPPAWGLSTARHPHLI
jgi:hypothetical protein